MLEVVLRLRLLKRWCYRPGEAGAIVIIDNEEMAQQAIDRGIVELVTDQPSPVIEENIVAVADVPEVVRKTRGQRKRSRNKVQQ